MEIERKWLFDDLFYRDIKEDVKRVGYNRYGQAYLSICPEIRIRWKQGLNGEKSYKLCVKSKGKIERIEVEKDLTEDEFNQLMIVGNLKAEDFIIKDTLLFEDAGGNILAVGNTDIYRDTRFVYGEIEFKSVEEANAFVTPEWFGKEVTEDDYYKMANYWKRTRIDTIEAR
ncbi:MAG: adenylate cyclase [Herbinix sp.]|nr:adenylate cyclase [Herbinix sp.]